MKMQEIKWGWVILGIIAGKFLLYTLDYLFMLIYSLAINPGQPESFYQNYIFENRFWINSLNGTIVMFFLSWLIGRKVKQVTVAHAMVFWFINMLTDVAAEFVLGNMSKDWGKWLLMEAIFFVVCYLGGRAARRYAQA